MFGDPSANYLRLVRLLKRGRQMNRIPVDLIARVAEDGYEVAAIEARDAQ
jgi:hypothetical protein